MVQLNVTRTRSTTTGPGQHKAVGSDGGARRRLRTYLRDHHAGAVAGNAMAERCLGNNRGTGYESALAALQTDIEEDCMALEQIMAMLEVSTAPAKDLSARVAEFIGRFKINGQVLRYSPSSRVVELEALILGITGKQQLWQSLSVVAVVDEEVGVCVDVAELDALLQRASHQLARATELHRLATTEAFTPAIADTLSNATISSTIPKF
jgi:hypothetical protein